MAGRYAKFKASFPFTPDPDYEGEIEIGDGDVILVDAYEWGNDFDAWLDVASTDWITGTNLRTGLKGMFPGNYVQFVQLMDSPLPSNVANTMPSLQHVHRTISEDLEDENKDHRFKRTYFDAPVWCQFSKSFIWGYKKEGYYCQDCQLVCHMDWIDTARSTPCTKPKVWNHDIVITTNPDAYMQWPVKSVKIWLCAVGLSQYVDFIHQCKFNGLDLKRLNVETLERFGIRDPFHRVAVMNCVNELCRGICDTDPSAHLTVPIYTSRTDDTIKKHRFRTHTYTSLTFCDKCTKTLFGLLRQGEQCRDCGYNVHRSCISELPPCCPKISSRKDDILQQPAFGMELSIRCRQVQQQVPHVVTTCIQALEKGGLQVPGIYSNKVDESTVLDLRLDFNQNWSKITSDDNRLQDPNIAACVLKRYLIELPVPLLSFKRYDEFIDAVADSRDDGEAINLLLGLCGELSAPHQSTLKCLMIHLKKKIVTNAKLHVRIVSVLLQYGKWNEEVNSGVTFETQDTVELETMDWYWGKISKEDVTEKLKNTPEGSFMVRDASKVPGEYTLTLKKGGFDRLIRICHEHGHYGFSKPLRFRSVVDLISHYQQESLAQYNRELDIKLMFPITRQGQNGTGPITSEDATARLRALHVAYLQKTEKYDNLINKQKERQQAIQNHLNCLTAQREVVNMFKKQRELLYERSDQQTRTGQGLGPEKNSVIHNNYAIVKERYNKALEKEKTFKKELDNFYRDQRSIESEMEDMKPEIHQIGQEKQYYERILRENFNYTEDNIRKLYNNTAAPTPPRRRSVEDHNTWLFGRLKPDEVNKYILGKPTGTFLVRESINSPGNYSISISINGGVYNVRIVKEGGLYGVATPCEHQSLRDLIVYYNKESLEKHNPNLKTTLKYPLNP
ncbi:Phosphatidylinositol 3-kinase regulatory subunit alpha [Trichoplax sp. H2]|nr:Phosphatidylinositol 3-kinase regulatory subunit alpha [Trichoplax sp. H2]|eukprot:RDD43651.1 Phosphatidylinositol 3-kinase regulatory subunit alpha [Trichoplax sp. H2]